MVGQGAQMVSQGSQMVGQGAQKGRQREPQDMLNFGNYFRTLQLGF